MAEFQQNIFSNALAYRESMITRVDTWEKFKEVLDKKGGFVLAHWDGTVVTEVAIKDATKATIRCIPFDAPDEEGKCIFSGKPSHRRVRFARSYKGRIQTGVSAGNGRMGAEAVRSPFFVPSPEAGRLPLFCGACPG